MRENFKRKSQIGQHINGLHTNFGTATPVVFNSRTQFQEIFSVLPQLMLVISIAG